MRRTYNRRTLQWSILLKIPKILDPDLISVRMIVTRDNTSIFRSSYRAAPGLMDLPLLFPTPRLSQIFFLNCSFVLSRQFEQDLYPTFSWRYEGVPWARKSYAGVV